MDPRLTLCHHHPTGEQLLALPREHLPQHTPTFPGMRGSSTVPPSQLQMKAKLTHAVGTIPLPTWSTFIPPGRICRAASWGKTGVMELVSDTLREVKLRLMDAAACNHYSFYNHNLQICVGNPRKARSAYKVTAHLHFLLTIQSLGDSVLLGGGGVRKSLRIVTGV